jgi:hypothetical protein
LNISSGAPRLAERIGKAVRISHGPATVTPMKKEVFNKARRKLKELGKSGDLPGEDTSFR